MNFKLIITLALSTALNSYVINKNQKNNEINTSNWGLTPGNGGMQPGFPNHGFNPFLLIS